MCVNEVREFNALRSKYMDNGFFISNNMALRLLSD